MTADDDLLRAVPGLSWNEVGGLILQGPALALFERLDHAFAVLAARMGAAPIHFVPVIAAADLRRVDYFSSFPHLVTMPVSVEPAPDVLRAFAKANSSTSTGPLAIGPTAPVRAVLAPAACYAVYPSVAGESIPQGGRTFTTVGTCFRREEGYAPLRRQACFRMREIIHLGAPEEIRRFLDQAWEEVHVCAAGWGLSPSLVPASDPFFDPARSSKYLHQKLFPNKHEMIWNGVALGSLNDHRNFFGEAFGIQRDGAPAFSGCVAMGLERWMWAIVHAHGPRPSDWPADLGETW